MKSPFFWKNLVLVLVVLANFAFVVWLIARKTAVSSSDSVGWQVALRSLGVMYATVSCLLMVFAVMEFTDAEFSKRAQECWKRQLDWKRIQPGMTKKQVIEILGPADRSEVYDLDRNIYGLDPLNPGDNSSVSFSIVPMDSAEEPKVVEKDPTDEYLKFDYFHTYSFDALKGHFVIAAQVASFIGILLLAVVSILPIWPSVDCLSLSLYIPVAALVLCIAYEMSQRGGWRFDLFFLIPPYLVILAAWIFRIIQVAQKSA